ncbi:MAG: phenylalanine--tRNA ligase subunit beta, partial [Gemmatimonadetes bacterium]|nr:phenylalanine--tRNA ligase subunit beta [Gemmatimonadota bacterium]
DPGSGTVQVVCGAANVQAGGLYPYAPPGSTLPNGMTLKAVSIRGVESQGMLCSEAELDLGADADGIMALDGDFEPGAPLAPALGLDDWLLDVEVTPNRGDLLSHAGVARELGPSETGEVALPPVPGSGGDPWERTGLEGSTATVPLRTGESDAVGGGVTVRIEAPEFCSRYLGAVIRGVRVGPSPAWLASRIRAVGSRPINNVVDATNYVLMELGQPLHAFDLSKLGGSAIVVRTAQDGEIIRTLDGEVRKLGSDMLAICDAFEPVAIAGVMGGADSEVSHETTDVLLECALFDPKSVRATRNALDMSTDASFRFERGVDPEGMELAVRRAVEIILATAGGRPDPEVLDACPSPWAGLSVTVRPSRVKALLGITLSKAEIMGLLTPLGYRVVDGSGKDDSLTFAVPGFRSYDTVREVDLLEEVARTYGYDRFPSDLGPFRPGTVPDHPLFQLEDELRDLLVGEGFLEAQTMAFAPESDGVVEVSNPVSKEEAWLRTRLLPGLVRRVEYNFARGLRDIRLFELGTVFRKGEDGEDGAPQERPRLAITLTGARSPMHWSGAPAEVDLWYLKGLLERLVEAARLQGVSSVPGTPSGSGLVPGEGFTLVAGEGREMGFAGRLDAGEVDAPAWAGPLWVLEIGLPEVPGPRPVPLYEPPPAFPGVDRDLALLLPRGIEVQQVEAVIRETAGPLLVGLGIFDLYEGEGVPKDHRSVAFRLRYQSKVRTLTDQDVEQSVTAVNDRLREELGVETRG